MLEMKIRMFDILIPSYLQNIFGIDYAGKFNG